MWEPLKTRISQGFIFSIGLYTVLHFVELFYGSSVLEDIMSVLALSAMVCGFAFLLITKTSVWVPFFLIVASVVIDIMSGHPIIPVAAAGLLKMRGLIGLLFMMPMIGWVLEEAPYIESIMYLARGLFRTSRRFYFGMMLMTQLIAYFLLFGSISVTYQFEDFFLKDKKGLDWEYFKGTGLLRAFALSTLWIVSIPSFIYAVSSMGGSLGLSIIQGFFISMAALFLAVGMMWLRERRRHLNFTERLQQEIGRVAAQTVESGKEWHYVRVFVFIFLSLFGLIFLIHGIWQVDLLVVIPLVILGWTILYFAVRQRMRRLSRRTTFFVLKGARGKTFQFLIMLSAGLMISSLQQSGWAQVIVNSIIHVADLIPLINMLWLLPFILILLGFMGLGPLTVIVLVGGVLQGVDVSYPPELIILSLTSGSVISVLLSPFVMPVIMMSSVNGLSVYRNGFGFNIGFAVAFYLMVQLYLQLVVWLIS